MVAGCGGGKIKWGKSKTIDFHVLFDGAIRIRIEYSYWVFIFKLSFLFFILFLGQFRVCECVCVCVEKRAHNVSLELRPWMTLTFLQRRLLVLLQPLDSNRFETHTRRRIFLEHVPHVLFA